MMKKFIIITVSLFLYLFLGTGISQAAAISMSEGTITVDWGQLGSAVTWNDGSYQMNGADAFNGSTTISDYPGAVDAEASFGANIIGAASTTITSVLSIGYVENNGTGLAQNASGTSHLRRWFTVVDGGSYSFSADYKFDDFILTDYSSENVSGYHHASLSFWEGNSQTSVIEAYSVGEGNQAIGTLTFWTPTLIAGNTYSFEIHTYNAASAYSPQPVPIPATMLLFGLGLLGLVGVNRRKK